MAISFAAGQLVTSAEMNLLCPTLAIKSSNQSVTNSTTLVNDNDIVFTFVANQSVHLQVFLGVTNSSTTTNIKIAYGSTGTLVISGRQGMGPAGASTTASSSTTMHDFQFNSSGAVNYGVDTGATAIWENLIIATGASGGTLTLQWAQNSAGGAGVSTTVASGSFAVARYVA